MRSKRPGGPSRAGRSGETISGVDRIATWGNGHRALGAYSPAVLAGGLCFVSGQLPLHPGTEELVAGDAQIQGGAALDNVEAILAEAGLGLGDVAMLTVLLADINDWATLDAVVAERFGPDRLPARMVYQAGALPLGALVEIQAIASR